MRRYYVVSGTLFILSIIDFALAAPLLVQENRQPCVNVVHMPKNVITVLGKRAGEDLLDEFYKWMEKQVGPSGAHAGSGSAPPRPDHWSTNVVQGPMPSPASSTANPDPLMEPSGASSTAQVQGDHELYGPLHTPLSTDYGSYHGWTAAHVPQPNPSKRPLTDPDRDFDLNYPPNLEDLQPPGPVALKRPKYEFQMKHVQQPSPGPDPDSVYWAHAENPTPPKEMDQAHEGQAKHWTDLNPDFDWTRLDPEYNWNYWMNMEGPRPAEPALPKEIGQAHESQVEHAQKPSTGPLTDPDFEQISLDDPPLLRPALQSNPAPLVPRPSPSPYPELPSDPQSPSADS